MNMIKWQVAHLQNNFATCEILTVKGMMQFIRKTHLKEIGNRQKNSEDE